MMKLGIRFSQYILGICICVLCTYAHAEIPLPGQNNYVNPNTQVYGTYSGYAGGGGWNYQAGDPYLASQGYSASGSYQQYYQAKRQENLRTLGSNLLTAFTGDANSFGERVKFFALKTLNDFVVEPLGQRFLGGDQAITFDNLYALANQHFQQKQGNAFYAQAQDCTDGCMNQGWHPNAQNPNAIGNLTQFSTSGPVPSNTSQGGAVGFGNGVGVGYR